MRLIYAKRLGHSPRSTDADDVETFIPESTKYVSLARLLLDSREGIIHCTQSYIFLWLFEMIINSLRPSDSQAKAIISQVLWTMKSPELPFLHVSTELDPWTGLQSVHEQSEPPKFRITASPPGCSEIKFEQSYTMSSITIP